MLEPLWCWSHLFFHAPFAPVSLLPDLRSRSRESGTTPLAAAFFTVISFDQPVSVTAEDQRPGRPTVSQQRMLAPDRLPVYLHSVLRLFPRRRPFARSLNPARFISRDSPLSARFPRVLSERRPWTIRATVSGSVCEWGDREERDATRRRETKRGKPGSSVRCSAGEKRVVFVWCPSSHCHLFPAAVSRRSRTIMSLIVDCFRRLTESPRKNEVCVTCYCLLNLR